MTKTSLLRIYHVAVFLPLVSLLPATARGFETTTASAHICSGCAACNQPAVPRHALSEHRCIDHHHRSGHPETQSEYARPSLNRHYSFGYVGGGGAFRGEPRYVNEGTWGSDYSGILLKKNIWLPWLHGHREPRHDGSYHTDGPHLLGH